MPWRSRAIILRAPAGVAQLVEQRIRNAWVGGSNPSAGTNKTKSVKTFALCVAIGTAVTLALFGLGYVASDRGAETLSYFLYWQAYVMYLLLPCSTLGIFDEWLCESMTAAKFTFFGGIPIGIVLYSALAYLALRLLRRRRAGRPQA